MQYPLRLVYCLQLCVLWIGFVSFLIGQESRSSAPLISGNTFRSYANHVFDQTTQQFHPENVQRGDIIFVKTDWDYLECFFTKHHPKIQHPYVLLTHNSDHSAPGPFRVYLDSPLILAWFAQNIEGEPHSKLYHLPIGIANRCWEHGNPAVFWHWLSKAQNKQRPYLCYLNFAPSTYPEERGPVWDLFAQQAWCKTAQRTRLPSYLQDLSRSQFVISPRGNGLDCHRTWEALLMGAIPIVRTSSLDPLFAELPVLIVEDWNVISESFLNQQLELIKHKTYASDKLFIHYWIKEIRQKAGISKQPEESGI